MDDFLMPELTETFPYALDSSSQNSESVSTISSSEYLFVIPGIPTSQHSTVLTQGIKNEFPVYPNDQEFQAELPPYLCSSLSNLYKISSQGNNPSEQSIDDDSFSDFGAKDHNQDTNRKKATHAALSRRREQNRASQRAYRDRKDRRLKELEDQLEDMVRQHENLMSEHQVLRKSEQHWRQEKEAVDWLLGGESQERAFQGKEQGYVIQVVVCRKCYGETAVVKSSGVWAVNGLEHSMDL